MYRIDKNIPTLIAKGLLEKFSQFFISKEKSTLRLYMNYKEVS